VTKAQNELLFGVRRSIRYHQRRRQYFDRLRKLIHILTVFSGVGTVTTLVGKSGEITTLIFASVVSLLSIIDLVIGTAEAARLHADLARRFVELERKMALVGDSPTEQQVREFTAERLTIEIEEPPILKVLDCMCHNELLKALGYGQEYNVKLTFWQKKLAPFFDWFFDDIHAPLVNDPKQ
jgi:hypothetical protein